MPRFPKKTSSTWAKFVLTFSFLTLPFGATAQAQCSRKIAELPANSELLGFKLGMTKDEVKQLIPQTAFGRADEFGVTKTTINPYFDPKIDKNRFANVRSISLDFVDDRLISIWIGYDEYYRVHTLDDLIRLLSQSLQLSGSWSPWKSKGEQLQCGDFQIIVTTVAGGPSVHLIDTGAEDLIAERRQAKEAAAEAASDTTGPSEIVGDKQTKIYYLTDCPPPRAIAEELKVTFKSEEEALRAGFKLAKTCH